MPSEDELLEYNKNFWGNVQSDDARARGLYKAQAASRVEYLTKILGVLKGFNILDIGAGQGYIFDSLRNLYGASFKYFAVDTDIKSRKELRDKGIDEVYSNCTTLPKKYFDLIIMSHILEHLPYPREILNLAKDLLKNDGVIFIEVPNEDHLHKTFLDPHLIVFNKKSIEKLLCIIGMEIYDLQLVGRQIMEIAPKDKIKIKIRRISFNNLPFWILEVLENIFRMENKIKGILIKPPLNIRNQNYHDFFQLNSYGEDRQWLRVLAKI